MNYKGMISDWIKSGHSFFVESGNYYESGKLPPENQKIDILTNFEIE
jgi:hypothetical protein